MPASDHGLRLRRTMCFEIENMAQVSQKDLKRFEQEHTDIQNVIIGWYTANTASSAFESYFIPPPHIRPLVSFLMTKSCIMQKTTICPPQAFIIQQQSNHSKSNNSNLTAFTPNQQIAELQSIDNDIREDIQSLLQLKWTEPFRKPLSPVPSLDLKFCKDCMLTYVMSRHISMDEEEKGVEICLKRDTLRRYDATIATITTIRERRLHQRRGKLNVIHNAKNRILSTTYAQLSSLLNLEYRNYSRVDIPRCVFTTSSTHISKLPRQKVVSCSNRADRAAQMSSFMLQCRLLNPRRQIPSTVVHIQNGKSKGMLKRAVEEMFNSIKSKQSDVPSMFKCLFHDIRVLENETLRALKELLQTSEEVIYKRIVNWCFPEYCKLPARPDPFLLQPILAESYNGIAPGMMKSKHNNRWRTRTTGRQPEYDRVLNKPRQFLTVCDDSDSDDNGDKGMVKMMSLMEKDNTVSERSYDGLDGTGNKETTRAETVQTLHVVTNEVSSRRRTFQIPDISVPKNFISAPWSIRVSEHVLQTKRFVLLAPPRLSTLPSIAVLIESHLKNGYVDGRVAIVCDGDKDDFNHIADYAKSVFAKSSISVIRNDTPEYNIDNGIDATKNSSRIVVVDRLSTRVKTAEFSLLVVLVSCPSLLGSQAMRRPFQKLRVQDISRWKSIPSVIISALNIWTGLKSFTDRVCNAYNEAFNISHCVYVDEDEEIEEIIKMARARVTVISPTRNRSSFSLNRALDEEIKLNFLQRYNKVEGECRWKRITTFVDEESIRLATNIRDISIPFIKEYISQLEYWDDEAEEMAHILDLKQMESYNLYNGFDTAVEYFNVQREKFSRRRELYDRLSGRIKKYLDVGRQRTGSSSRLPVGDSRDQDIMNRMRKEIDNEPTLEKVLRKAFQEAADDMCRASITDGIYRRLEFKPLIIADATETCAHLTEEFGNSVRVFKWDDIFSAWEPRSRKKAIRATTSVGQLESYSHIYHILDGRHDEVPDYRIPLKILDLNNAGLMQLTTLCVDSSCDRTLRHGWQKNDEMYRNLGSIIGNEDSTERLCPFVTRCNSRVLVEWLKAEDDK